MSIAGHHTVAELRDWLAALDYQIGQIEAAYVEFAPRWSTFDRAAYGDWSHDWSALRQRYGTARAAAAAAIDAAQRWPIPDSAYPVEDEWRAVHRAVRQNDGPSYDKGDLQDLYNRLVAARGASIDMSQTPQPNASDLDLNVFNGTGDIIQFGKDAWNALPTPDVSKIVPSTGTKVLIGGGLLLGLALVARGALR